MQSNHAIPQNVTQYQFRLVGDMTLKQFLELAGGLLLAYLFYSSNLIFLFKYPLALGSVFFGVALAFFPIEDRPLDIWIINFIKAIYGPTRFIWEKTKVTPPLFFYEPQSPTSQNNVTTKTIKAPARAIAPTIADDFTPAEKASLDHLNSLLGPTPHSATPEPHVDRPLAESVTIRKLSTTPSSLPPIKPAPAVIFSAAPATSAQPDRGPAPISTPLNSVTTTKLSTPTLQAQKISLPATPTTPNLISGLLLDSQGHLLENAIVQIVTGDGITQRAVRSNALGQFAISTPLSSGVYYVEVEKDGYIFGKTELKLDGHVLSPIQIRATS